jgi:hypothetical protein
VVGWAYCLDVMTLVTRKTRCLRAHTVCDCFCKPLRVTKLRQIACSIIACARLRSDHRRCACVRQSGEAKTGRPPMASKFRFRFEAPKGRRLCRYFYDVTCYTPAGHESLWWYPDEQRWGKYVPGRDCSTHAPCRTLRAFKRHLRKHKNLYGEIVLVNLYAGFDVSVFRKAPYDV